MTVHTDALAELRAAIRARTRAPEAPLIADLVAASRLEPRDRAAIAAEGAELVRRLRRDGRPGLMEAMLAEYGLSTEEGLALMCLAEALLRVPDAPTIDALIEDRIGPGGWAAHFGRSASALVNASTLGLALTGRVLHAGEAAGALGGAAKRLGRPVIRVAVGRAMREMGRQFVLGETIEAAAERAEGPGRKGYTHSYDMLGEAAMTAADADAFHAAYAHAIEALRPRCGAAEVAGNPGVSIKLSALHPRYEVAQADRVMADLVPRVATLARAARDAGMGLNVDAEEADRLDLSLDVIEAALADPSLAGWDGFGVVVQAYSKRAAPVIEWLHALASRLDRRIMVRLVKGAYWDAEIKRAQVAGLPGYPVFTRKPATDVSFVACARMLLDRSDRIYPQFATHNAHTIAAILAMAGNDRGGFEFQRLHGMGEALHEQVRAAHGTRCRIYAPVGRHRELLAYLVRRLLENGANSSFVNKVVDERVPAEEVAADPFEPALTVPSAIPAPRDLFAPRVNSAGLDLACPLDLARIEAARAPWRDARWRAAPVLAPVLASGETGGAGAEVRSPSDPGDVVGEVVEATEGDARAALDAARPWDAPGAERAAVLRAASDRLEARTGEIFALLAREAGKGMVDALAELREAVDFLRYYASEAERLDAPPLGIVTCISPWNFPLAIFTGQVAGALAAGNAVLAKPAEATPLIAALATEALHEAGVPRAALQLLPGTGPVVGAALTSDPRVGGVCFTGSTATAQAINRTMAEHLSPHAPLIAETGGINAMVVDSTALPEQAVRDVIASAFRSAGQRCSALRVLYVQRDVADGTIRMLKGAMDALRPGDPWDLSTDIGPVIGAAEAEDLGAYVARAEAEGRLIHRVPGGPGHGVGPAAVRVDGIEAVEREVFGPVLHVATFPVGGLDAVLRAIEARGYGLTFGLHTRLEERAESVASRVRVGNAYVNRNQIGAVVGSQPFGGEGLSGTGPKAGGPRYVARMTAAPRPEARDRESTDAQRADGAPVPDAALRAAMDALPPTPREALETLRLPGPTGEENALGTHPRGPILCLGPGAERAAEQARQARACGCPALVVAAGASGEHALGGTVEPEALTVLEGVAAVAWWGGEAEARALRRALAARPGALTPLLTAADLAPGCTLERHVCTDTTAAGGDAALIAGGA